jgi:hypothetical protein
MPGHRFIIIFLFCFQTFFCRGQLDSSQTQKIIVKGTVNDAITKKPIENANVKLSGSLYEAQTDKKGRFLLSLPSKLAYKILFSHFTYQSFVKEIRTEGRDTIPITVEMNSKVFPLDTIPIYSIHKPETLVGKPNYSVFDFDFYEDKLLLLTSENSLSKAQIRLADYSGKIYSSFSLPKQAGEAKRFFHDYEGYTDIICQDSILRMDVFNNALMSITVKQNDFKRFIDPVSDTAFGKYYFDNNWEKYPSFGHYSVTREDSLAKLLKTITNEHLMEMYNFEYYFLPSRMQLEARRLADYYKTDVHIVAAMMSGFTQSMFYEPLYAPLFILKDTICIFNHYNDHLYHYSKNNKLIDSVPIAYHHPKNWRHWKKQLFVDEPENKVYAFFSKDGHHYLKQIDFQTGKEIMTYKLKNHSGEKIKIRDGYVYYVYRPFDSTQERFLYRERIE